MRLGIDFGTTRTVVALADRGNYPVIGFQTEAGDAQLWYPSLIAARGEERVYALDAEAKYNEPGWHFLRSLKRLLGEAGPDTPVELGGDGVPALELLTGFLKQLKHDLIRRSNLEPDRHEALETWIAVPANANSNQRFLTLEGFRRAGFKVLGVINEPSAAGIEYAQRYARKGSKKREQLVVYDLGGGTFDTSVITMKDQSEEILSNEGISKLGGDDVDELLLEMTLEKAGVRFAKSITDRVRHELLEECRHQKEALHANTRKLVIDAGRHLPGAGEIVIPVDEFYSRCAPMVERTMEAVEQAVANAGKESGATWNEIASVYLVGGSSDLPVVGRMMRAKYGQRVKRSPYPYAATAIGLAILADTRAGYRLQERFTRYFGVWREADSGHRIVFDPIFPKGTLLPKPGEPALIRNYAYRPVHTIGHYRYLECGSMRDGQPAGDLMPWDEVYFPLDPDLQNESRPHTLPVMKNESLLHQEIEERYACHQSGMIEVTITNHTAGYHRTYRLKRR